jgi:phosphatidylglycerol:prolipoprotein diacylglycerol transferase
MIPILLRIGPITIYSYGFMVALASSSVTGWLQASSSGYDAGLASSLVLWVAIASFGGARLNDVIDNWRIYSADPKSIIFSSTGFVFYGGFIGGLLASIVFARRFRIRSLMLADMCAPALALAHAIGRQGCQLSGYGDWGTPSRLPWAMAYPRAIVGWNAETVMAVDKHGDLIPGFYSGVRVHPTPIYESALYLAVFLVLRRMQKRTPVEGRVFYIFLMLYGASRFLVEFLRSNPRLLLGLSEAQLISLVMMIAGGASYAASITRHPPASPMVGEA